MRTRLICALVGVAVVPMAALALLWALGAAAAGGPFFTVRISISTSDAEGDGDSYWPALSADGLVIAFHSYASNLVPEDTNGTGDVFLRDRQTAETVRVSVASDGTQGNNLSYGPSISADGRYIAFESMASNLVISDTNNASDVFVHDRQTGQTIRVSTDSVGQEGNNPSGWPSISADGRYIAFQSFASNLVVSDTNEAYDIFVHDRQAGQLSRISVSADGAEGNADSYRPSPSADGRFVAFQSFASNLVASDTNNTSDVFVYDRQTGVTTRISRASDDGEGNGYSGSPALSGDGRFVAFESFASNLVLSDTNALSDVFVHDRQTGQTTRISTAYDGNETNENSFLPSMSANGRYVAFQSLSSNLVAEDTNDSLDVFSYDRETGQMALVSVSSDNREGNESSARPAISSDGRVLALGSLSTNMVFSDTNSAYDIVVREPLQTMSSVAIGGPITGVVYSEYGFSANVSPLSATPPITYTWQATGYSPAMHIGNARDSISFTWPISGTKLITLTATNAGASAMATHTVYITTPVLGLKTYLPLVGREYAGSW